MAPQSTRPPTRGLGRPHPISADTLARATIVDWADVAAVGVVSRELNVPQGSYELRLVAAGIRYAAAQHDRDVSALLNALDWTPDEAREYGLGRG